MKDVNRCIKSMLKAEEQEQQCRDAVIEMAYAIYDGDVQQAILNHIDDIVNFYKVNRRPLTAKEFKLITGISSKIVSFNNKKMNVLMEKLK